jgi:membrane-bound serine protease (ClpP class)
VSATTYLVLLLGLGSLLAIVVVISLWRHKKSGTGAVQLIGKQAVTQTDLTPEGSVLVDGELWRAASLDGTTIASQERVEVTQIEGLLLVVKRAS